MRKFFLIVIIFMAWAMPAEANALRITGTDVETDLTKEIVKIRFNIYWENSFKDATNYDAVWLFVKYSTDGGTVWNHATLKTSGTNPTDFSVGSSGTAVDIDVPTDKKGCFIHRNSNGTGTTQVFDMKVVWDYDTDLVTEALLLSKNLAVKVMGMEMVQIPTASFYAGDGSAAAESTYALHRTDNTSFQITTANATAVTSDSNTNDDIDTSTIDIDGDGGITGNASFPTGYPAFYLMKYEITEGAWVTFFNMLTTAQKANRDVTGPNGKNVDTAYYRNVISWSSGDATTTRENRAMNFLSWPDLCAYADWTALRPMTELEYEKAARGPTATVLSEYAWGSATVVNANIVNTLFNLSAEYGSETAAYSVAQTQSWCNMGDSDFHQLSQDDGCGCYDYFGYGDTNQKGPLRVGIFATSGTTTRATAGTASGAGYYGNMDLSGNVFEFVVSLGNSGGRAFTGTNGDGNLTGASYSAIPALTFASGFEGNATNEYWPGYRADDGISFYGVSSADGAGLRGGGFSTSMTMSARTYCPYNLGTQRSKENGGRLARTI